MLENQPANKDTAAKRKVIAFDRFNIRHTYHECINWLIAISWVICVHDIIAPHIAMRECIELGVVALARYAASIECFHLETHQFFGNALEAGHRFECFSTRRYGVFEEVAITRRSSGTDVGTLVEFF